MSKPNNPPAFPNISASDGGPGALITHSGAAGMTLRDYFAAKALQSLLAQKRRAGFADSLMPTVKAAYDVADAMLEERAK